MTYFCAVYALSVIALAVIGVPTLHGEQRSDAALVIFPLMVVGVGAIGIGMIAGIDGRDGLRDLYARWRQHVPPRWFLVLLIPPLAILAVLFTLSATVSSSFEPNLFVFGIAAGVLAGMFEEVGWTGFAYPRLSIRFTPLAGALLLGVLWGLWHFPVIDSLGAASPHRDALPVFILGFVVLLAAVRVLIAWVYNHTRSLLMAQLLHASSTGSLVLLSASKVTPSQEATWYLAYAALLWIIVGTVVVLDRTGFTSKDDRAATTDAEA
jgi:membrane protease YdiL (CAAX protease family)